MLVEAPILDEDETISRDKGDDFEMSSYILLTPDVPYWWMATTMFQEADHGLYSLFAKRHL